MPSALLKIIVPFAALLTFGAGAFVDRAVSARQGPVAPAAPAPPPDFDLIQQAWTIIDREYVDRSALKPGPLTEGAITGMVEALGDTGHSTLLTPPMVREEQQFARGEYVGVGLEIEQRDDGVRIVAPLSGSPASAAGLRPGELILRVNGESIVGAALADVIGLIEGPVGSQVTLGISDPSTHAVFDVTLTRRRIRMDFVSWQPIPGTPFADLRIEALNPGVDQEVKTALREIERQGMRGVVLDLRTDPGGALEEAVSVASEFLAAGDVLLEEDSHGAIDHDKVRPGGTAIDLPLVVLVDEGTASGAEIVAGALQDARRAPIVGTTTFGTGTVLRDFPLPDGSALRLAVREWLTPAGHRIWHKGVVPDTAVALPPAIPLLTPGLLKGMTREALDSDSDLQMKKALDVLGHVVTPGEDRATGR